jgi:hypothetical protein
MRITLSRRLFFVILFLFLVAPFSIYKLYWILESEIALGKVQFTGHGNLGSVLGMSTYPVILFQAGKDSVYFNGNIDAGLKENTLIEVRYHRGDPSDAKMNTFMALWGDTLAYTIGPALVFLAVFFMNDIVPKDSRIMIGATPFIKIVSKDHQ